MTPRRDSFGTPTGPAHRVPAKWGGEHPSARAKARALELHQASREHDLAEMAKGRVRRV